SDEPHAAICHVEDVVLLDLHHRQVAPLGAQRVPQPGQVLLLGQQLRPRRQPFVSCGDLGKTHLALLTLAGRSAIPAPTSDDFGFLVQEWLLSNHSWARDRSMLRLCVVPTTGRRTGTHREPRSRECHARNGYKRWKVSRVSPGRGGRGR